MKVIHWSLANGSGLANVAADLMEKERELGIDSSLCITMHPPGLAPDEIAERQSLMDNMEADVHVAHSHVPDNILLKVKAPVVYVQHGTPEHIALGALDYAANRGSEGDSLSMSYCLMKHSKAVVSFHERHADILRRMTQTPVHYVPMGVSKEFWKIPSVKKEKMPGIPSLLYAENSHVVKWPFDLLIAWSFIMEQVPDARLHIIKMPLDQHRVWFPLATQLGVIYTAYMTNTNLTQRDLRNLFGATDYMISPVMKGDHNRLCLEAVAANCKLISYRGNPYASYWLTEGDQRIMAKEIVDIFEGKVEPREHSPVPDIAETASEFKKIYEKILA